MSYATSHSQAAGGARRLLIGLTFLGFISLGLPDGLLGVAWPSMASSLGVEISALGRLIVAFSVGYLTISVVSGRLLAQVGVGVLLAISCAATALSLIGFSVAPTWIALLPLAALLGAGGGAIDAGLNAYAAAHFSPRVINWLHACYGIGATAGPALMTAILSAGQSWQLGYGFVGASQLTLAACFLLTRQRWNGGPQPAEASAPVQQAGLRASARLPAVWLSCAVFLLYTGLEVGAGQWSYTLLVLGRGVPEATAGQWISLYWGSLTVGRILAGFIAGRVRPQTMLWSGSLGAFAGILLVWADTGSWLSLAGLVLAGLSLAPIFPLLIATTAARVGEAHTANSIGFQVSAANIGAAFVPWAIGLSIGVAGIAVIGAGLVIAAGFYLALFILLSTIGAGAERQG